jgi:hypothetical protein
MIALSGDLRSVTNSRSQSEAVAKEYQLRGWQQTANANERRHFALSRVRNSPHRTTQAIPQVSQDHPHLV